MTNTALEIDDEASVLESERTCCAMLALDTVADDFLHHVQTRWVKLAPSLRDGLQTDFIGSSAADTESPVNFPPSNRQGGLLLILASRVTAADKLRELEDRHRLRRHYVSVLVLVLDDSGLPSQKADTPLPTGYHCLQLDTDENTDTAASVRDLVNAYLAMLGSVYDEGLVCVDPVDFVWFCANTDYLLYQRHIGNNREEVVNSVQCLTGTTDTTDKENITSAFICFNANSDSSLEEWAELTDAVADKLHDEARVVSAMPFYQLSQKQYGIELIVGITDTQKAP